MPVERVGYREQTLTLKTFILTECIHAMYEQALKAHVGGLTYFNRVLWCSFCFLS